MPQQWKNGIHYNNFKENFRDTNLDSISKTLAKVHAYNQEVSKFIQEVNVKYGIPFDYAVLEVSEVPHWAEAFQVLAKLNVQQEAQTTKVPAPNFSVPSPQVNINLSHQQAEIKRLTQITLQWSAEGPHQYNPTPVNYNQDMCNTNVGRGKSVRPHSTPNMSSGQHNRNLGISMNLSNRGMATMIGGFNITVGKSQTKADICTLLKHCQTMLIIISPLYC